MVQPRQGGLKMKKTIYTLNIGNYAPEIRELTYPLLKRYAHKIGAEFFEITERKYPQYPPVYEKFQIYDLGREHKNDWNIYIDADTLIHPEFPDITTQLKKDTVCFHWKDFAPIRFRYDKYFLRDGRNIGEGNWFAIASDWCLDLWHPLDDITFEEAVENIFPTYSEMNTVIKRDHLIDDYLVSRNIARYGLKHCLIMEEMAKQGLQTFQYLFHEYLYSTEEKVIHMRNLLDHGVRSEYPQIPHWKGVSK
jgi:hypothetical protein